LPVDLPTIFGYRSQPSVAYWMPSRFEGLDECLQEIDTPEVLGVTVAVEHNGAVIGDLLVKPEDCWAHSDVAAQAQGAQAEIGWCIDSRFHGQGLATEAATALVALCFLHLGVRRVTAVSFADNLASVMDMVGMTTEARFRQDSLHRDLGWVDTVSASILRTEWENRSSE
jgi:RimJ/RimL family protein N-acetyltransferase